MGNKTTPSEVVKPTLKERYAELHAKYNELMTKYECACATIDRYEHAQKNPEASNQ